MPIKTDLSVAPYYDDYDENKKFVKILFKPEPTAVQVREMNQFSTIIQNQIERLGDNIFKKGTIIDGCNFTFHDYYPYCKLSDISVDGTTVNPGMLENLYVKNANNLIAYVKSAVNGYESSDPNLKTIYVNYLNSGDSLNQSEFNSGDILTFYSPNDSLFGISVESSGINFSNTDQVIISSALLVERTVGTFSNGEYIVNPSTSANVQIVGITNVTSNVVILNIKPRATDLANSSSNSSYWSFDMQDSIKNVSNTVIGTIIGIFGSGARASIVTDSSGKIIDCVLTNAGKEYSVDPQISVRSPDNGTGIATSELIAKSYLTKIKVPTVANAVGNAYAFSVSNGVIYQKGHLLKVSEQSIVVSAYSSSPNNVSVGFDSKEEIITADLDPSLFDNVLETENENAPGADRLRITPLLVIANTDIARSNSEFFSLVEWSDGKPYKLNQQTVYSKIGDEMAQRTKDESGNFVLDPFYVTTISVANSSLEGNTYTVVVDPGKGYIDGYRLSTLSNYKLDSSKAIATKISNSQKISINYDNYIRVKEVGGLFQFSTGDVISFYTSAKGFISNTSLSTSGNTTPQGTLIGNTRIRSMILESGSPGDPNAVYRLYIFGSQFSAGKNFKDVKSVYYNGTYKGIADLVLERDATSNTDIAKVYGITNDQLVFKTNFESIRSTSNSNYIYRTIDQTTSVGNNGILTKSIASTPDEFYPYSGFLSSSQLSDLYVVPIANNLIGYTPLTGTVSVNNTSQTVIGTGTLFLTELDSVDYINISPNNSANNIKKIISITNNTFLTVDSNCSYTNTSVNIYRTFPKNVPVPFGRRSGLSANVDANGNILTLNFGLTFAGATSTNTAIAVNIQRTDVSSTSKTANRNRYVKLRLSNNAGGSSGPWCLGVPNAFRLRSVQVDDNSSFTSPVDITNEFYIDSNQTTNYHDLSYLYKDPKSSVSLTSSDYLLVEFDHFTSSGAGYYDTVSYLNTSNGAQIAQLDSLPLANLGSAACSWEIPEFYSKSGEYFDLINCIDFRPSVVNTVATSTTIGSAPINPDYTLSFGNTASSANEKKFPLPDSLFTTRVESYMGRVDEVIVGKDTNITILSGIPSVDPQKRYEPNIPDDCLKLQKIVVPPYPNITTNLSRNVAEILDKKVGTGTKTNKRAQNHTIEVVLNANNIAQEQPKAYTMGEIGQLERRIKTLEYYVPLNSLETSMTKKIIPSSIDQSINRFKYGFFVDDFSTSINTDLRDPQYAASFETVNKSNYNILKSETLPELASNLLVPPKFTFGLKHNFSVTIPDEIVFYEVDVVQQNNATEAEPPCNKEYIITSNTISSVTNAYFFSRGHLGSYDDNKNSATYGQRVGATRYINCDLSDQAGQCTLYFYTKSIQDPGYFIHQGSTPNFVTSNSNLIATSETAVALTSDDQTWISSNPYTIDFWQLTQSVFTGATNKSGVYSISPRLLSIINTLRKFGGPWVAGSGKFSFNYNPANGKYLKVVYTVAGDPFYNGLHTYAGILLVAPFLTKAGTGSVIDPCGVSSGIFNGTMNINNNFQVSKISTLNQYDYLTIDCYGLKPSSRHYLFIDGSNQTNLSNLIKPINGNFGDPLVTDQSGRISFEIYFPDSYRSDLLTWSTTEGVKSTLGNIGLSKSIVDQSQINVNFELKTVGSMAQASTKLLADKF